MKSQLRDDQMTSTEMDTDTSRTTTTIDNNFAMNQLQELHDTIALLGSGAETLNEDAQQLQRLTEILSKTESNLNKESISMEELREKLDIECRELISLKEKIDDMQYVSNDGTFTWRITNVREKMSK
jgi:hypothetical protein